MKVDKLPETVVHGMGEVRDRAAGALAGDGESVFRALSRLGERIDAAEHAIEDRIGDAEDVFAEGLDALAAGKRTTWPRKFFWVGVGVMGALAYAAQNPKKVQEMREQAPDRIRELREQAPGKMRELREQAPDKMRELREQAPDKLREAREQAPGKMREARAKVEEKVQASKDSSSAEEAPMPTTADPVEPTGTAPANPMRSDESRPSTPSGPGSPSSSPSSPSNP